jgi:hypothetical protein
MSVTNDRYIKVPDSLGATQPVVPDDDDGGSGLIDGAIGTGVNAGEAWLDWNADRLNALTGTGENLGWWGVVDRRLDARNLYSDDIEWAEPTSENDGIFAGLTAGRRSLTTLGYEAGRVGADPLLAFFGLETPRIVRENQDVEETEQAPAPSIEGLFRQAAARSQTRSAEAGTNTDSSTDQLTGLLIVGSLLALAAIAWEVYH